MFIQNRVSGTCVCPYFSFTCLLCLAGVFCFFLRTAICISSLFNIDCHEFTFFWGEQMELVTSCQRKTMCCVFKVPKELLHFQTKSIHCVGNMLSVNLSAWFINFSFAEMRRYFSLCKWNKISLEISNVKRVWFMKVKFSKHTIEVHHSMQNSSSANLSMLRIYLLLNRTCHSFKVL